MTTYEYLSYLLKLDNMLGRNEMLSSLIAASSPIFDLGDEAIEQFFSYRSEIVSSNVGVKLKNLMNGSGNSS
jgi:hypothetical protein